MASPSDAGDPISYEVLAKGTPVLSSDGEVIGRVVHVLADEKEDVFDGIVIDEAPDRLGGHRFADADDVDRIYERAVVLKLDAQASKQLHRPQPNPAVMRDDPAAPRSNPIEDKLRRAWEFLKGNY